MPSLMVVGMVENDFPVKWWKSKDGLLPFVGYTVKIDVTKESRAIFFTFSVIQLVNLIDQTETLNHKITASIGGKIQ